MAKNKYKFLVLGFAFLMVLIDQFIKFIVVKNIIERAVEIKEENDLTI